MNGWVTWYAHRCRGSPSIPSPSCPTWAAGALLPGGHPPASRLRAIPADPLGQRAQTPLTGVGASTSSTSTCTPSIIAPGRTPDLAGTGRSSVRARRPATLWSDHAQRCRAAVDSRSRRRRQPSRTPDCCRDPVRSAPSTALMPRNHGGGQTLTRVGGDQLIAERSVRCLNPAGGFHITAGRSARQRPVFVARQKSGEFTSRVCRTDGS